MRVERLDPATDGWKERAACAVAVAQGWADPEVFFPETGETVKRARAKAFCGVCAVRAECLEDALRTHDEYGIRGGTTAGVRIKMRRHRESQAPTVA